MAQILYFMGYRPNRMENGEQWSQYRCASCSAKPQLRAVVEANEVVDAGCPLCGTQYPCEVVTERGVGKVYFFPPGTQIVA